MIVLEPFSKTNNPVIVDWDYALKAVENLDTSAQEENRRAIPGKAVISILAEYGAIFTNTQHLQMTISWRLSYLHLVFIFARQKKG